MTSSIEKAMAQLGKATTDPNESATEADELLRKKSAEEYPNKIPSQHEESHVAPGCNLDYASLERRGFLTPNLVHRKIADEYRAIKRPLLANVVGKSGEKIENGNVIMVVSALPSEGKTFTSFNLAISIAMEKNNTVLLVDSDIIKPSLSEMLGLQDYPGLTDVLLNPGIGLADVIVKTNVPKLNVIPAGSNHMHSTELLASLEMERVANEIAQRYTDRIIIFDAPPVLVTTEAPVLTRLAGQILVVVEAGRTEQNLVKEAVEQLDNTKVIGMVLNKSRVAQAESHYGSGYGYGYYGS